MKFHVPSMALFDEKCHRVEERLRRYTLFAGAETAPRFNLGVIPRVGFRSYLKDNGVDSAFLQVIQLADKVNFHLIRRHFGVFTLEHGLYPCPAKFALRVILCGEERDAENRGEKER